MPPLTKKPEANTGPVVLPWHPNFRNYERLPDIKVVRTTFFVNMVAITLVALFAGWVAFNEYEIGSLRGELEDTEKLAETLTAPSNAEIERFRAFQTEEKSFVEIDAFVRSRYAVAPLVARIGETLPKNIAINYFNIGVVEKGKQQAALLVLRGVARGAADAATGRVSSYEAQLRDDPVIKPLAESVSLTSATRNKADDRLSFEIQISLNPLK